MNQQRINRGSYGEVVNAWPKPHIVLTRKGRYVALLTRLTMQAGALKPIKGNHMGFGKSPLDAVSALGTYVPREYRP